MSKWIEKPSVINESNGSSVLRTYAVHVKVGSPYPCPKNATPRMIGDEFVWYRLYQTKGRGNAVVQAANWFTDLRFKGGIGKILQGKEAYECVVVDDPWNECSYGSEFNPIRPVNRLLDEETKERVIEESKGNLKFADSPFKKGQSYPSLEWTEGAEKKNVEPIKTGIGTFNDPSPHEMKDAIDNAVERAKKRRRNKQIPLMEELKNQDARIIVSKMRQSGLITRDETKARVFRSDRGVKRRASRLLAKLKKETEGVRKKQKDSIDKALVKRLENAVKNVVKEDADKWIHQQETKASQERQKKKTQTRLKKTKNCFRA